MKATVTERRTNQWYELCVKNLACPDCALKLQKRLQRIPRVGEVKIDFARGKLQVRSGDSLPEVIRVVEAAGYEILREEQEVVTSRFQLSGLDCPQCAIKLEGWIERLAGVVEARLDFQSGNLVVTHRGERERIIKTIEDAGYGVKEGKAGWLRTKGVPLGAPS